jgi:flagellar motility protein MotE (MotC chaperone)
MDLEEIEKPYSKLQWIFYILIVPSVFTLLLVGIIFTFLGHNVIEGVLTTGHKVPGLSAILPEPKEPVGQESDSESIAARLQDAEQRASESEQEIGQLEHEVAIKIEEIKQLTGQIEQLKKELEDKRLSNEERLNELRELAQIYEGMSTSKSAAIIEKLTLREAALIMNQMDNNQQSAIMSKLAPTYAANLTIVMKEMNLAENPEIAALQERINLLMNMIGDPNNTDGPADGSTISIMQMVNTFSQLPPLQAATILNDMSESAETEFQLGLTILANMDDAGRSAILAVMSTDTARKYTSALLN